MRRLSDAVSRENSRAGVNDEMRSAMLDIGLGAGFDLERLRRGNGARGGPLFESANKAGSVKSSPSVGICRLGSDGVSKPEPCILGSCSGCASIGEALGASTSEGVDTALACCRAK